MSLPLRIAPPLGSFAGARGIHLIERNAFVPSATNALRIARALGTTVEALFGGLVDVSR